MEKAEKIYNWVRNIWEITNNVTLFSTNQTVFHHLDSSRRHIAAYGCLDGQ